MKLEKDDYILGIWYAQKHDLGDWMCTVRKPLDSVWEVEYRFKYYKEGDSKNFYTFTISGSNNESDIIDNINKFFEIIKIKYSDFSDYVEIKGDIDKFFPIVKEVDWLDIFQQH